jgi:hypothetical protein
VSRTVFDLQPELTTRQSELAATLDELERTFAQVPRVGNVDGCSHCWTAGNLRALGGDPARVPDAIVVLFAQEVPSHWVREQYGSLWRTFAGRILRLVAAHPDHYLINFMMRGPSSHEARFADWPDHHRTVLRRAFEAMLAVAVLSWRPNEVTELLEGLGCLDPDLVRWLGVIDQLGPEADAGVISLVESWTPNLAAGEAIFWLAPDVPVAPLSAWVTSAAVQARIARGSLASPRH